MDVRRSSSERNHALFCQFAIDSLPRGLAVDLSASSGFQSIPLVELGFSAVIGCAIGYLK
ncbi:hypothetical protein [Microcoleus sp. AT3-D2]|uniref:hypothetical protein n=1 Tax=Microcoleus sp. AT3-D2 TaxID=2818612 RepID=UPI002FD161F9